MPLIGHLQFGDNNFQRYTHEYLIRDIKCTIIRNHNSLHPVENPKCDNIELSIFSTGNDDFMIQDWFINNTSETGRILIGESSPSDIEEVQWKQIYFEDAYCFELKEVFNIDEVRRTLIVRFTASNIIIDNVKFSSES